MRKLSGVRQEDTEDVLVVQSHGNLEGENCFNCSKSGHLATKCHLKDATSHKCGGRDRYIRTAYKGKMKQPQELVKNSVHHHHALEHHQDDNTNSNSLYVRDLTGKAITHRFVPHNVEMQVSGKPLKMELHTGASWLLALNVIFEKLWP